MYISTWILTVIGIMLFYFIEKRFKKIENYINIPEGTKNVDELKPISYQVGVSIEPEWIKVIRWCFPKLKSDDEAWKFVENLYKDTELKLDKEAGLFQKHFWFVEFYDGVSGLNPVWSTHHKGFLNEMEIWGHVFDERDGHKNACGINFPIIE